MDASTEGTQGNWQNMGFVDGENSITIPEILIPKQYLASFDSGYGQGVSNIQAEDFASGI